ncbi:MAG: hypothetical protein WAT39_00485 [Planctomycetota bacterium]
MRNQKKRIEQLEARLRPSDDRRLDALLYRMLATFGATEDEQRILLEYADAVEAGTANSAPPIVGALVGIMGGPMQ